MNAEPAAQLRLLDLQALDSRLDLIAHRRRTHPAIAAIADLDTRLAALRDRVVAAETEVADLERGVGESGEEAGRHARESIRRLSSDA